MQGVRYLQHPNWLRYQKMRRPLPSDYPAPSGASDKASVGQCPSSDGQTRKKAAEVEVEVEVEGEADKSKSVGYTPSPESQKCLKAWEEHIPLPASGKTLDYCKVFDDLHHIDKLPWERVHAICRYACEEWGRKYIQSPLRLRKRSKSNEDMKMWEVIEGQLQGAHNGGADGLDDLMSKIGSHD